MTKSTAPPCVTMKFDKLLASADRAIAKTCKILPGLCNERKYRVCCYTGCYVLIVLRRAERERRLEIGVLAVKIYGKLLYQIQVIYAIFV